MVRGQRAKWFGVEVQGEYVVVFTAGPASHRPGNALRPGVPPAH